MRNLNPLRAFVALFGIAIVSIAMMSCGSVSAQTGGLLDALFGGFTRAPPPGVPAPTPLTSNGTPRASITVTPMSPVGIGGSVAHCVRLCDGGHFPLPRLSSLDTSPGKLCNALCPATQTRIYWGSQIDQATAANGVRYSQLKTAFKYRRDRSNDCTCNGSDAFGTAAVSIYADVTLRSGDIVVADNGLKVFVGSQSDEHLPGDFTPIQQYPGLSARVREKLESTLVAPRTVPEPKNIKFNGRIIFGVAPPASQIAAPDAVPENR